MLKKGFIVTCQKNQLERKQIPARDRMVVQLYRILYQRIERNYLICIFVLDIHLSYLMPYLVRMFGLILMNQSRQILRKSVLQLLQNNQHEPDVTHDFRYNYSADLYQPKFKILTIGHKILHKRSTILTNSELYQHIDSLIMYLKARKRRLHHNLRF